MFSDEVREMGHLFAASVLHPKIGGYHRVLALLGETEYVFPLAGEVQPSWLTHLPFMMLLLLDVAAPAKDKGSQGRARGVR